MQITRIRAGFEPRRGRTTPRGSFGPKNAPTWTTRRTPTAQIRRGLASKVVAVVHAEIFALPRRFAHSPCRPLVNPPMRPHVIFAGAVRARYSEQLPVLG
jgi:hypothetical protein